jgi:hypothetical protein
MPWRTEREAFPSTYSLCGDNDREGLLISHNRSRLRGLVSASPARYYPAHISSGGDSCILSFHFGYLAVPLLACWFCRSHLRAQVPWVVLHPGSHRVAAVAMSINRPPCWTPFTRLHPVELYRRRSTPTSGTRHGEVWSEFISVAPLTCCIGHALMVRPPPLVPTSCSGRVCPLLGFFV